MITDISTLENGQPCFVEIYGETYEGTVDRQQTWDRTTRVITAAAQFVHHAWKGMSFRWKDGGGYACRWHSRLIVPTTAEEQAEWEGKAKRTAAGFGQLGLGLDV